MEYFNVPPPVAVIVIVPSDAPLHVTLVDDIELTLIAAGSVIVTLKVWVHPFASFAVTV
jgi:hypothetical protein